MGMVHTAHHTLAQQTFRLAGIIEKSLPYPHNCLQKLKFKLAKTNYTHYTSSYTETQQTRAFSDHFALWKCGKRLLRRWKADIHGPMEKPPAFPQPANIVSHSSASMTVYAHSHSAYYGEYPSCPILIERDKREQKKKRERHPWLKPKAALPLCNGKVFKIAALHPSNQRERPA